MRHQGLSIRLPKGLTNGQLRDVIKSRLQELGYDGLAYRNDTEDPGSTSYVAFHPEQIKSAIGNTGEFNPASKSITDRGIDRSSAPDWVQKSDKYVKDLADGKIMNMNPVEALYHHAITTGWDVYKGTKDFAVWSKQMVEKLGERIRPYLDETWNKLNENAPTSFSPRRTNSFREDAEQGGCESDQRNPTLCWNDYQRRRDRS